MSTELLGMLARQRARNKMLADAVDCLGAIVRDEQKKHEPESAEWRRWNACVEIADKAMESFQEVPQ